MRSTIEKIIIRNGEMIYPWEVEGNISPKLIQVLEERGVKGQYELEKYFEKPAGKTVNLITLRAFS